VDPVTFLDTGDPSHFTRYAYANNDPVNRIDPDGEVSISVSAQIEVPKFVRNIFIKDDIGAVSAEIGIAVSVPVPFIDNLKETNFDIGVFGELGAATDDSSFGVGGTGKVTGNIGIAKGDVADLAGRGGEISAQIPVTPIPGTVIPNPIGPSVGAGVQLGENGDFQGLKVSAGFGTNVSAQQTQTGVISIETIANHFLEDDR
jgi:hypothetical protein